MAEQLYTVKAGDTLSKVASQYGVNVSDISGYASGDPNKIGVGENLKVMTRDVAPVNTVNATNLGQAPFKTPPTTPATGYAGLIASTNAAISTLTPDVDQGKADIKSTYDKLGQQSTKKADAYTDEKVYEKQGIYNNLVNNINQKELGYQTRIDKIRNENPTGQLTEGQTIAMDKLSKDWAIEKAGLSISAAFAKDDYTLAKTIVDDRIAAETEGLTNELEGLKYFYTENVGNLSDEKKSLLQFQIKEIEDEKAAKEQMLSEIGAIQLAAAENGAPADVVVGIGKSTDLTTAITNAGSWIDQTLDRDPSDDGGGSGSGMIDLAPEDERTLVGAGYSTQDIADIKKAVSKFGFQAVLDAESDPKKQAAIRKVYGVEEPERIKRTDIEAVKQADAVKWLEDNYNEEELVKLARDKGFARWYRGSSGEKNNFLKSEAARKVYIEAMVKKATDAGWIVE